MQIETNKQLAGSDTATELLQEYTVHLIQGHEVIGYEQNGGPLAQKFSHKFRSTSPTDVLTLGNGMGGEFLLPVRNIVYIESGSTYSALDLAERHAMKERRFNCQWR